VNLALHTIGQVSNVKLYERKVDEANPFDLFAYWFEYDAGGISQIVVVVIAVAIVVGLVKWVLR
jgi:hypothetical protein